MQIKSESAVTKGVKVLRISPTPILVNSTLVIKPSVGAKRGYVARDGKFGFTFLCRETRRSRS